MTVPRRMGGDLGLFVRGQMVNRSRTRPFRAQGNELSGVVKSEFAITLFR